MNPKARAPERLVQWWKTHRHPTNFGFEVSYHSRSDAHSKKVCQLVMEDLFETCGVIRRHAESGEIGYEINHEIHGTHGNKKMLDLVIGQPKSPLSDESAGLRKAEVVTPGARIILEAKNCMTEHSKALPRLHDEISSAMQSSLEGASRAITCGLVVINLADSFISTQNQKNVRPGDPSSLTRNKHIQPKAAIKVIERLQSRLPMRTRPDDIGFDCLAFILVEHDNEVPRPTVRLVTESPAPSGTSPRNYEAFLVDICNKYRERFGTT